MYFFTVTEHTTPESLKQLYKSLCKRYHPDKGGNDAIQAQINVEYQQALRQLAETERQKKNVVAYDWVVQEMEQHWLRITKHVQQNRALYEAVFKELGVPMLQKMIPVKYRVSGDNPCQG